MVHKGTCVLGFLIFLTTEYFKFDVFVAPICRYKCVLQLALKQPPTVVCMSITVHKEVVLFLMN